VAPPSKQRLAQGAFFLILALFFAGVSGAGGAAAVKGDAGAVGWAVAIAAGAIALWFFAFAVRGLRPRRASGETAR
jgi:hypothetical protein